MTNLSIKEKMKEYFIAWVERDDNSYNELFNSLRTLRYANLITEAQWIMIYNYDRELFSSI